MLISNDHVNSIIYYHISLISRKSGGSMGSRGKKKYITGQVRSYKYVRNKRKKCGILLVKASRPLWSID